MPWCKGNKIKRAKEVEQIKTIAKSEFCKISKEEFKIAGLMLYWSKITNIALPQLGKSYIKKEGTGHRKNVLYNGTIRISICDMNLLHRIQGWIEAIENNLPA